MLAATGRHPPRYTRATGTRCRDFSCSTTTEAVLRMANIASQVKRNRQNERARQRNKHVRSVVRTAMRRFDEAVEAGDAEAARTAFVQATSRLDRAAGKGVVHANYAANHKSSMARRLERL